MTEARSRLTARSFSLVAGLLAIYFLPYLFGHPDGHSQSYLAHFSNRVALLSFLGISFLLAWTTRGLGLQPAGSSPARASRKVLFGGIAGALCLVAVVWWLSHRLGAAMETGYFLDRYSMYALGLRLYGEFEFPYGPLMFYPQLWLARWLHLAPANAHFAVTSAHWIAGIALLWYVCRRLTSDTQTFLTLFALFCAFWLTATVDGAMNYTPLRFLVAPALVLKVFALWKRSSPPLGVLGWALAGFYLLLFLSPEQGIAFGLGTLLFFGLIVRSRALVGPLVLFTAGCALGLRVAYRTGVLSSMLSFGGGSLDYPLLPSAQTAVLLLGLMIGVAVVLQAIRSGHGKRPEVYLALLTLFLLPAAFGRCDPGHVFINTLPLLAIAFCALARQRRGYAAGSIFLGLFVLVYGARHGVQYTRLVLSAERASHTNVQDGRAFWPAEQRLIAPFGFVQPFEARTPLPVFTGKFASYRPLNDQVAGERIAELAHEPHTAILVPANSAILCSSSEELRVAELKFVFRPFWIPPARAIDPTPRMLCDYIAAHYTPGNFQSVGHEAVWLPRP